MKATNLWRLPVGSFITDYNGQVFKILSSQFCHGTNRRTFTLECVTSPFPSDKTLGPITSAFFCRVGDTVQSLGGRKVFPCLPLIEKEAA